MNVKNIREIFKTKLENEDFVIDRTGVKMIEIINASFVANEPVLFGTQNLEWFQRELEWYKSQSLNVNDIQEPIPKVWQSVADADGFINSNYGWCIYSEANFNQYQNCLKQLKDHKDTRRAVMIYTRPKMQYDFNMNGRTDFICCQYTAHLIRNNVLTSHIYFRSNDAIFGYKGDYFWMDYVHQELHNDLLSTYPDLQLGDIHWNAASLHVYEKHLKFVEEFAKTNRAVEF